MWHWSTVHGGRDLGVGVGMGMMMFNFSDMKLVCFREKFSTANWSDYQCDKLGP